MKRLACILLAVVAFSVPAVVAQEKPAVKPADTKSADWKGGPQPSVAREPAGRRDLTVRQRRELGLTITNLVEIAKELKADGEIDVNTPHGEVAAAIAVRLESQNQAAFKGTTAFDLDSILEFIERLIPLILKLIELFS